MTKYRSPGVYIEEKSLLPPSIAEVESAVPAFVGYTEIVTQHSDNDLLNLPTPINNLSDFNKYFGGPDKEKKESIEISIVEKQSGGAPIDYKITVTPLKDQLSKHILYHAIRHFFANGGSRCFIVSVGKYSESEDVEPALLINGINLVADEDEPTILLVPEAINLKQVGFDSINQKMINQAATLKDRFAIIDTLATTVPKVPDSVINDSKTAIEKIPIDNAIRRFGAVYYPFLETSYNYVFDFDTLIINSHKKNDSTTGPLQDKPMVDLKNSNSSLYNEIKSEFEKHYIVLPPSAAIAGVYARVDRERGYWKAPANVGLMDVVKAQVSVSRSEHDRLNINAETGKSVNAIRNMPGYGIKVMGARTLDGNDNEWKYINVRRVFSIVEESVKNSTNWVIFEPNISSTWVKVKAMIENYLFLKWRDGSLAGSKPEQAYFVNVGLGKTMNSVDILEGRLIVEIGMAVVRPAEFIILTFSHKMQTS
jgi:hypothetical protein